MDEDRIYIEMGYIGAMTRAIIYVLEKGDSEIQDKLDVITMMYVIGEMHENVFLAMINKGIKLTKD